jgi:hypothetical protein
VHGVGKDGGVLAEHPHLSAGQASVPSVGANASPWREAGEDAAGLGGGPYDFDQRAPVASISCHNLSSIQFREH